MKFYKIQGNGKFAFVNLDSIQDIHVEQETDHSYSIVVIFIGTKIKGIKIGGYTKREVAYKDLEKIGKEVQKRCNK
jgi:hypothetical protein